MLEGKLSNLIKFLDAHTRILIWNDEDREDCLYNRKVWELYNLIDKDEEFMSYYIKDMIVDYDGIRVVVSNKQY